MVKNNIKGIRKFLITISALIVFGVIMVSCDNINPFSLGMGIGMLITPTSIANIYEHKGKQKEIELSI